MGNSTFSKKKEQETEARWKQQFTAGKLNQDQLAAAIEKLQLVAKQTIHGKQGSKGNSAAEVKEARAAIRAARSLMGMENPEILWTKGKAWGTTLPAGTTAAAAAKAPAAPAGGAALASDSFVRQQAAKQMAASLGKGVFPAAINVHGSLAAGKLKQVSGPKPTGAPARGAAQAALGPGAAILSHLPNPLGPLERLAGEVGKRVATAKAQKIESLGLAPGKSAAQLRAETKIPKAAPAASKPAAPKPLSAAAKKVLEKRRNRIR